jgi:hypothetical protein
VGGTQYKVQSRRIKRSRGEGKNAVFAVRLSVAGVPQTPFEELSVEEKLDFHEYVQDGLSTKAGIQKKHDKVQLHNYRRQ